MLKSAEKMTGEVLERIGQERQRRAERLRLLVPVGLALAAVGIVLALQKTGAFSMSVWNQEALRGPAGELAERSEESAPAENRNSELTPPAATGPSEENPFVEDSEFSDAAQPEPSVGVSLPAIEIKPPENGAAADMIGLVVFKGNVYTAGSDNNFWGQEARALEESLLGNHLGSTLSLINCFSSRENPELFQLDFASTYEGELYTVQGYDPEFRLAIVQNYDGGDEDSHSLILLDHLNGIGLDTGVDLFGEQRLNLAGRIVLAEIQRHEDWDYAQGNFQAWDFSQDGGQTLEAFLERLYAAPFEDFQESDPDRYLDPERRQLHLFFHMSDGTIVQLRLWEDGAVAFQGLGWADARLAPEDVAFFFERW